MSRTNDDILEDYYAGRVLSLEDRNRIFEFYFDPWDKSGPKYQACLRHVANQVGITDADILIEVGAGTGNWGAVADVYEHYIPVDIQPVLDKLRWIPCVNTPVASQFDESPEELAQKIYDAVHHATLHGRAQTEVVLLMHDVTRYLWAKSGFCEQVDHVSRFLSSLKSKLMDLFVRASVYVVLANTGEEHSILNVRAVQSLKGHVRSMRFGMMSDLYGISEKPLNVQYSGFEPRFKES